MSKITVSGLSVYPIKSCREVALKSSFITSFGLENDRRWMVIDELGHMITQRQVSKLCLIQVYLTDKGLLINSTAKNILSVTIPKKNKKVLVKVWNDECRAHDAGDEAAFWFSKFLSLKCRLVYFPDDEFRQVDLNYASAGDKTAFSDGFPLLLISQASLDDLNSRLDSPVSMARFRPNIVVSGCDSFAEDQWKKIRIGSIVLKVVKPCSRCVIPSINIDTAEREAEPTKTLLTYRKNNNKIYFGQNVISEGLGKIDIGMNVEVVE